MGISHLHLDRLVYRSVLDELRSSAPSSVAAVDFGPGGKPVEIGAAGKVLYLPALHLQLWRNTVVPHEANFDADAFDELQDNISTGAIRTTGALDGVVEIDSDVCILSNLYSNNFFHCFEELYKVTILERSGYQGCYVLSPFGDRHFACLKRKAGVDAERDCGVGSDASRLRCRSGYGAQSAC